MKNAVFKKWKVTAGFLLVILAVSGMFFWELKGRDLVMTEEVIVAKNEIQKGTMIETNMFETKGVPKSNLLKHALRPDEIMKVQGKVCRQLIAENGQVIPAYFQESNFDLNDGESIYVLDAGWISMRSSALRRGDLIEIYQEEGNQLLGTYRVAFVKDEAEREVRNAGEEVVLKKGKPILERTDSTSIIDHIEIITTLQEYEKIKEAVVGSNGLTPGALLIVQAEES